jgi:hypothetical protein
MLGRLASGLRERRGVLGTGMEGMGAGEHATVVLDDNCSVRISCLLVGMVLTRLRLCEWVWWRDIQGVFCIRWRHSLLECIISLFIIHWVRTGL